MKKTLCAILILCLLPVIALADDLASMSYDDLIALSHKLTAEIMSRPEWKEVTVPAGTWKVGEDIPAGTYSISAPDKWAGVDIWRKQIDDFSDNGLFYSEVLQDDNPCGKITLLPGMIIVTSKPTVFAPPMGLGF